MPAHGLADVADAAAFLTRLIRLDAAALVRLRSGGTRTALWARLPWDVLVTRHVATVGVAAAGAAGKDSVAGDATVSGGELLAELTRHGPTLPSRRDQHWRWPLPPGAGAAVDSVSTTELARLDAAAADTLRAASSAAANRALGPRAVRDALLDHIALTVTPVDGDAVAVPQRLVQAVARMGFLGQAPALQTRAQIRVAGRWVGLAAPFGTAWFSPANVLTVTPVGHHPNG